MNDVRNLPDSILALPNIGKWRNHKTLQGVDLLSLGAPCVDDRIKGGLKRNALHEIFAAQDRDVATASAFALLLTLRLNSENRRVYWIGEEKQERMAGRIYAPGLVGMGADPAGIVIIRTANMLDALRASADVIRSKAASAVIIEAHGSAKMIDMTSSRRLSLAAADAGVLALLVRVDAMPMPSAASSRWQIRSAPSTPLPANAPGMPTFDISLLRHRSGIPPFETTIVWDYERQIFHDVPLSGGLSAVASGGAADPGTYSRTEATA